MSELSIQELVELSKSLQGENVLARLGRAHQIVDGNIAMLRSDTQSERALPDAMLTDLETARDAVFNAHAALSAGEAQASFMLEPLVNAMASLHNNINTLCWLIGESQADQDETLPGSFSNADDLFDAMGV